MEKKERGERERETQREGVFSGGLQYFGALCGEIGYLTPYIFDFWGFGIFVGTNWTLISIFAKVFFNWGIRSRKSYFRPSRLHRGHRNPFPWLLDILSRKFGIKTLLPGIRRREVREGSIFREARPKLYAPLVKPPAPWQPVAKRSGKGESLTLAKNTKNGRKCGEKRQIFYFHLRFSLFSRSLIHY